VNRKGTLARRPSLAQLNFTLDAGFSFPNLKWLGNPATHPIKHLKYIEKQKGAKIGAL
jgi:hypothetical protein